MPRSALTARLPALALLLAVGGLVAYAAGRAGGAGAAVAAAVAFACAAALYLQRERAPGDAAFIERLLDGLTLAVPGALTVLLSFQSGGFYPAATAFAALVLIVLLILRVTLLQDPFAGFTRTLAAAVIALALFALWILASATWSDAPSRALVEFDRALVYLLALVLLGSVSRTPERLRRLVYGLAIGIVAVAVVALLTRLFAATFPTPANLGNQQLGYPLGYSNTLGLLCSLGAVLCLHLTCHLREPPVVRVLASAALPILAVTVYFTFSRGGLAAGAVGIAAYIVLGHPRGLLTGALASVPPSVIAVMHAYDSAALALPDLTTAAATAQGEELAVVLIACVAGAALLRLVLCVPEVGLQRIELPERLRRPVARGAWAAATLLVLVVALAADVPGRSLDAADRFLNEESIPSGSSDIRGKVLTLESSGLPDNWNVALDAYSDQPLHGQGAGTYGLAWDRERPADQGVYDVSDAHSLYLEVLAELGIVGIALLAIVLALIFAALLPLRRGPERSLYAALFAIVLAWAAHSAAEWNWEMPAVTLLIFGVGGAALAAATVARTDADPPEPGPSQSVRVALGAGLLIVAVCPALLLVAQHRLDDAVAAYYRADCTETIERATASISILAMLPEPYEAIAYCQLRRGNGALAVRSMEMAVQRDPRNWHFHFGLALVRGAAGLDPLPAAREAQRLNPHAPRSGALVKALSQADRAQQRRLTTGLGVTESLSVSG